MLSFNYCFTQSETNYVVIIFKFKKRFTLQLNQSYYLQTMSSRLQRCQNFRTVKHLRWSVLTKIIGYVSTWIWIAVLKQNNFKKVLVGLHETLGDPLENDKDLQNISLHLAVYRQFVWWIFQHLYKGNRGVILSCVVWSIRKLSPEADGQYTWFKEGERDWLDAFIM